MDFMCSFYSRKITVVQFKSFKTVMDKPIVEDEINDAINADAGTNPEFVIARFPVEPHQPNRNQPKKQTENVVQFKKTMTFLMMRFVDEPKRPVKQIFVHGPGNDFHGNDGKEND